MGQVLKNPFANAGATRDLGSISGLGRFPEEMVLSISTRKFHGQKEPGELQVHGVAKT